MEPRIEWKCHQCTYLLVLTSYDLMVLFLFRYENVRCALVQLRMATVVVETFCKKTCYDFTQVSSLNVITTCSNMMISMILN